MSSFTVSNGCPGPVVALDGEHAVVRSQPLSWDGSTLGLKAEREEWVRWSDRGRSLQARLETGDQVSLHRDWVCERLSGAGWTSWRGAVPGGLTWSTPMARPACVAEHGGRCVRP